MILDLYKALLLKKIKEDKLLKIKLKNIKLNSNIKNNFRGS